MNQSYRDPNESPRPWKVMKYVGSGIALIGFLLFFSVFISGAMNFGNFDNFEARTRNMSIRAVLGMFMIIGGGVLGGIAAKQGRNAGGESGPSNDGTWRFGSDQELAGPIKIRCQKCRALNDEAAKFCDQCGAEL
jgi:hypothetical protein